MEIGEDIAESWPTGARFYARPDNMIERSLIDHRNWEFRLQLRILNAMHGAGTFIDCGANIGVHSCAVARQIGAAGRVIAIEPVPWLADRLDRNRALNGLANLEIVRGAVGATRGSRAFYAPVAGDHNHGMGSFYPLEGARQMRITVPVTPLDDLLAEVGVSDVRVIKLDVEGAEVDVLRGAQRTLRRHRPVLVLEYRHEAWLAAGATLDDLQRLLCRRLGYTLMPIPGGSETTYEIEATPPEQRRLRIPHLSWKR